MEKATGTKSWTESKTKWGALLLGIAAVLLVLGNILVGDVGVYEGILQLVAIIGGWLGINGIRDLPLFNISKAK